MDSPETKDPHSNSSLPEDADPVWALLAKCPPPRASGAFVDNTLRSVRLAEADRSRPAEFRLFVPWLAASAFAAALVLAFGPSWLLPPSAPPIVLGTEEVDLLREELHLMTYVDELLTVSDPTTLDDAGLAELF